MNPGAVGSNPAADISLAKMGEMNGSTADQQMLTDTIGIRGFVVYVISEHAKVFYLAGC